MYTYSYECLFKCTVYTCILFDSSMFPSSKQHILAGIFLNKGSTKPQHVAIKIGKNFKMSSDLAN